VVPFSAFFPAGRADPTLIDRLTRENELQGLLRSAVGGLQSVLRRGAFDIPPSVRSATDRFKTEADPLRGFISERCAGRHPHNAPFVPRTEFYNAYTAWAVLNGFHQMSAARFYESFTAALIDTMDNPLKVITRDGVKGYVGVVIN